MTWSNWEGATIVEWSPSGAGGTRRPSRDTGALRES